jgi:hypothetical protein
VDLVLWSIVINILGNKFWALTIIIMKNMPVLDVCDNFHTTNSRGNNQKGHLYSFKHSYKFSFLHLELDIDFLS